MGAGFCIRPTILAFSVIPALCWVWRMLRTPQGNFARTVVWAALAGLSVGFGLAFAVVLDSVYYGTLDLGLIFGGWEPVWLSGALVAMVTAAAPLAHTLCGLLPSGLGESLAAKFEDLGAVLGEKWGDTAVTEGASSHLGPLSWANLTITPLKNLKYNLDSGNLALHGLHWRGTHAAANAPAMFGPLYIAAVLCVGSWVLGRRGVCVCVCV